jgi:hypothetical protein
MIFSIGPEALLTSLALLLALLFPTLAQRWYRNAWQGFVAVARHRTASVLLCSCSALALRAALLPILPYPIPYIHDEFSYLLAADTFAHGRITNPTPAMWIHFETLHVIFRPTYMSMYPPLQGLFLAAGKVIFGHPFWGVWLSTGIMCATICWMLQAWFPPQWALFGGLVPVARFGVFEWAGNYWGGAPAAIGGALVMGALPRIIRHQTVHHSLLMALGIGMLANSRPYEGFLLSITALALLLVEFRRIRHETVLPPFKQVLLPLAGLLFMLGLATGYYFYRVTGSPIRMPIQVNRNTYSMGRYFYWQRAHAVPAYHHEEMKRFYENEFQRYEKHRSLYGFMWETGFKLLLLWLFYVGPVLTIPLFILPWVVRGVRLRPLIITAAVGAIGIELVIYFAPHYAAPFTCVIIALLVQGLRHLRIWRWQGRPVGSFLAHAAVTICLVMVPIQIWVLWARSREPGWRPMGFPRQKILNRLCSLPGNQLVFVRYSSTHDVLSEEWVYNKADIEHAKIIWARDMGTANNQELLNYYKDRQVWLVDPDAEPPQILPYPSRLDSAPPAGIRSTEAR